MDGLAQSFNFGAHAGLFDWIQVIALVLSVVVAAVAAFYAIRDGHRNQERSELTVSPAVMFLKDWSNAANLGAFIRSVGSGPAIIDEVYVLYRGVPQQATLNDLRSGTNWWLELASRISEKYPDWLPEIVEVPVSTGALLRGEIFGSGQSLPILTITAGANPAQAARFERIVRNLIVVVFYHSVHGRRFVSLAPYDAHGNMDDRQSPADWIAKNYPLPDAPQTPG